MKSMSVCMAVVFFALSAVYVYGAEKTGTDAGALFREKCSLCHGLDISKSKKRTLKEWQGTVTRMKDSNGCPISDEEARSISEYLYKNFGK